MIRAQAKVTNPDEVVLEMTFTATVREWRAVQLQMTQEWPSWDFARAIREVISDSVQHVERREVDAEKMPEGGWPCGSDKQPCRCVA